MKGVRSGGAASENHLADLSIERFSCSSVSVEPKVQAMQLLLHRINSLTHTDTGFSSVHGVKIEI